MANQLLTIAVITREALMVLENNLTFTRQIDRQFDDRFGVDGAKIGTVLNVRKPPRYLGREGQALQIEDAVETQVPVALNTQFGVDLAFTSTDLALSIDDFSDRFIKPAIATVANKIDRDGLALFRQIYNTVGTPGTIPNAILTYLQAGVKLDNNAAPMDGERATVISPMMQATIVNALTGLFHQGEQISQQYVKGTMGAAAGFRWFMDQNVGTHTVGPLGGTPVVNGNNQTGDTILLRGFTAAAGRRLNYGDVITLDGVYSVNPQSRENTGELQQFVVTANVDSDASGDAEVPISPSIITSGAFQTVTNSPSDGAAVLTFGHASNYADAVIKNGLAFHRNFATLACADLPLPRGVDMAAVVSDKQLGLSIRMVRAYDINLDRFPCRLDILYGWAVLRPELACRVVSSQ